MSWNFFNFTVTSSHKYCHFFTNIHTLQVTKVKKLKSNIIAIFNACKKKKFMQ